MRKIFKIAQAELATLFYSPVAWLILVIFTFQAGLYLVNVISVIIGSNEEAVSLTAWIFTETYSGLFPAIKGNLYLYIPLLTMGLMSREISSGSIKLLYSSPLTSVQIIFGKYLSMMAYGLLFIAVLGLTVAASASWVPNLDIPMALTGLLGIYLLICAYAAIGLYMSCLTSYQIVAAVSTLGILAFLGFIGGVGQDINFVRDITYWLSMSGRVDEFIRGVICSGDVIYFLLITALFLALSVMKLQEERRSYAKWFVAGRYIAILLVVISFGYVSSMPSRLFYYDATANKSNTLSPASQEIMAKADGPLTITAYVNLCGQNTTYGIPSSINGNLELFRQYMRFKPDIKMNYVYYYQGIEYAFARKNDWTDEEKVHKLAELYRVPIRNVLSPAQIDSIIDLSGESYNFVRVLEAGNGKKAFLRMFKDMISQPTEAEISAAMKRLVVDNVPRVGFVDGHGERSIDKEGDRDYYFFARNNIFRYALINQGFDAVTLSLSENIPAEVNIVVISDQRTAFRDEEIAVLDAYIARGGNLMILGEPGRIETMNPLAERFGVRFMPGILVQPGRDFDADLLMCGLTEDAAKMSDRYKRSRDKKEIITMPGAVGLEYCTDKGFKIAPLLVTADSGCWNELQTVNFVDEIPQLEPGAGETEKSYPVLLALSREVNGREQRILIAGDADCMSNRELSVFRDGLNSANYSLITESFRWLSNGEFPVNVSIPENEDKQINLVLEDVSLIKFVFMGILPLLLVAGGIAVWFKRRGR